MGMMKNMEIEFHMAYSQCASEMDITKMTIRQLAKYIAKKANVSNKLALEWLEEHL